MKFIKTLKTREGKKIDKIEGLRKTFEKNKVKLAYLFGSYAKEETSKFSDLDIAVVFREGVEKGKMLDRLRIDLIKFLGEEAIDLVNFEEAPPKLQYRIIKEGKVIYGEADKKMEIKVMREYFDFKPIEEMYFKKMRERIEEGKYGH